MLRDVLFLRKICYFFNFFTRVQYSHARIVSEMISSNGGEQIVFAPAKYQILSSGKSIYLCYYINVIVAAGQRNTSSYISWIVENSESWMIAYVMFCCTFFERAESFFFTTALPNGCWGSHGFTLTRTQNSMFSLFFVFSTVTTVGRPHVALTRYDTHIRTHSHTYTQPTTNNTTGVYGVRPNGCRTISVHE